MQEKPILRFAPSPNGRLHLGHAYSALLNQQAAEELGGELLLRIEDIDHTRCSAELEQAMRADLNWLGIEFSREPTRQLQNTASHKEALDTLEGFGLLYPAFMSRTEIRRWISAAEDPENWPRDPDGAPHYPPTDRNQPEDIREKKRASQKAFSLRLNMKKASDVAGNALYWNEAEDRSFLSVKQQHADPLKWGDVVLARKDIGNSYHIACVVDDAKQGITHVVRGLDLFEATSIHRLLQTLLDLPPPIYFHHKLINNEDGLKLSKSKGHVSINDLREDGWSASALRAKLGF